MQIRVKITATTRCLCGHSAGDHGMLSGKCNYCSCVALKPDEPQWAKELRWIVHNLNDAKGLDKKLKWHVKLKAWAKAHPTEYKAWVMEDVIPNLS